MQMQCAPMSSGRPLEVQHLKWTSFWLQLHFHKYARDFHLKLFSPSTFGKRCSSVHIARKCNERDHTSSSFQLWEMVLKCPYRKEVYLKHPKRKGNISLEKGIRSKEKCRSSACRSGHALIHVTVTLTSRIMSRSFTLLL